MLALKVIKKKSALGSAKKGPTCMSMRCRQIWLYYTNIRPTVSAEQYICLALKQCLVCPPESTYKLIFTLYNVKNKWKGSVSRLCVSVV